LDGSLKRDDWVIIIIIIAVSRVLLRRLKRRVIVVWVDTVSHLSVRVLSLKKTRRLVRVHTVSHLSARVLSLKRRRRLVRIDTVSPRQTLPVNESAAATAWGALQVEWLRETEEQKADVPKGPAVAQRGRG
jgi:hypothetical protein